MIRLLFDEERSKDAHKLQVFSTLNLNLGSGGDSAKVASSLVTTASFWPVIERVGSPREGRSRPGVSLSLWHDAASPNEAGRAEMALPVCIVTGAALGSLSSVALSSAPAQIFYHAGATASRMCGAEAAALREQSSSS
jgi:hypothetical protein